MPRFVRQILARLLLHVAALRQLELHRVDAVGRVSVVAGDVATLEASIENGRAIQAQRLKRVLKLDLSSCETCGGQVRVIACLEEPAVIGKILEHLATRRPVVVVARGGAGPAVKLM